MAEITITFLVLVGVNGAVATLLPVVVVMAVRLGMPLLAAADAGVIPIFWQF